MKDNKVYIPITKRIPWGDSRMSDYKRLEGLDVSGKKVLVRVDYNVKIKEGKIKDDTRITSSLDTINHLIKNKAKVILMSHLGRPQEDIAKGKSLEEVKKASTLSPVAAHLSELIKKEVKLAPDCVGPETEKFVDDMEEGDILLLENLRWHKEEEENDESFAKSLSEVYDIYVLDGFGIAHRTNASTAATPLYMLDQKKEVVAGFLLEKELRLWSDAREKQGNKLLVIGGAKLKEKTKAISKLYKSVDSVLVGGAVFNIVMAGKGIDVGDSLVKEKDKDYTEKGKEISENADNLLLAYKAVIAKKEDYSDIRTISIEEGIPQGYMIADLIIDEKLKAEIAKAQVVIWFGNIGISDIEVEGSFPFSKGTEDFKNAINPEAYVVVGGGDSVTASKGLKRRVISTGGGASIKLYTKGTLDGIEALKGNKDFFKK